METMLVDEKVAKVFLPNMMRRFRQAGVEIRGCKKTRKIFPDCHEVRDEDYYNEYLDLILNARVVKDIDEAMDHIARYGSAHSDAIVTRDYSKGMRFLVEVDSSAVFVNASTRLNDGYSLRGRACALYPTAREARVPRAGLNTASRHGTGTGMSKAPTAPASPPARTGPLAGLKVVELGHYIAGPFCARLLADMGAEIIKIEPPGAGDPLRAWGAAVDVSIVLAGAVAGNRMVAAGPKPQPPQPEGATPKPGKKPRKVAATVYKQPVTDNELLTFFAGNPGATDMDAAQHFSVSRQAIGKRRKKLYQVSN